MPALKRNFGPRGARFYIDGDAIMFINVLDSATYEPPRHALSADREAHPQAWSNFEQGLEPHQLPMVSFLTPEGAEIPEAAKAKGSRAPV